MNKIQCNLFLCNEINARDFLKYKMSIDNNEILNNVQNCKINIEFIKAIDIFKLKENEKIDIGVSRFFENGITLVIHKSTKENEFISQDVLFIPFSSILYFN